MSAHPLTSPVEKDTFVSMPQAITAVSAKLAILLMSSVGRVLISMNADATQAVYVLTSVRILLVPTTALVPWDSNFQLMVDHVKI